MKIKSTKEISLTSLFAALYALAVIILAPISFNIFQVRVADALLPLSIVFGWPAIFGITLGTIIANFFGGLGIIDLIGGASANFIATLLAWKIACRIKRYRWIISIIVEILTVTAIVGSYLSLLFNIPIIIGLAGILIGSTVSIGILGYMLLVTISRTPIAKIL